MKLTKMQIIACNIIDALTDHEAYEDQNLDTVSEKFLFDQELQEYMRTGDREKLTICKRRLFELEEIFSQARKEWEDNE